MPAIVALLVRALGWLVATKLGQWLLKALVALGIGVTVHKFVLPDALAYIQSKASGMGAFLFQVLGAVGGAEAISIILSAIVAATTGKMLLRAVSK